VIDSPHPADQPCPALPCHATLVMRRPRPPRLSSSVAAHKVPTGSGSRLGALSCSSQALATQIPNRLTERLCVGNLPPG
jgi:hypothetical protein